MATNTRTAATTAMDVASHFYGRGQQLEVIDILSEKLPIFRDAHWVEANDFTTHHYMQTLSEPSGSDTVYNQGVAWELGLDSPVTVTLQGLESYSRVDVRILKDSPDPAAYRRGQDAKFVRGLGKSAEARVLYGRTTQSTRTSVSPDQILGLAAMFNIYNSGVQPWNTIQGSQYWLPNVNLAGGSTANKQSSAWMIKWAEDGLFMLFPNGGKGFVEVEPMQQPVIITDSNGNAVTYEITHFKIGFGVAVGDWRNVTRLANINKANDTHPWTSDLMTPLIDVMPDGGTGAIMYINRTTMQEVRLEVKNNANVFHFDDAPWGPMEIPYFMEAAIAIDDEITNTEVVIS